MTDNPLPVIAADPAHRPFRFGVGMTAVNSRAVWIEKCRKAEDLGYDVIGVADHIGMLAPFPALIMAAEVTQRPRLTTAVLNTCLYNPALLAREISCVDQLTDGRIEIGLGAGYNKDDVAKAGLHWKKPGERVTHLERTVTKLLDLLRDTQRRPTTIQKPNPPLWIAGRGDRLLRLAAHKADIVGFSGISFPVDGGIGVLDDIDRTTERIGFVRGLLGDRISKVEFNILVQRVIITNERKAAAARLVTRGRGASLSLQNILEVPMVLIGTPMQIAEQLVAHREELGISYITVSEFNMDALATVIEILR